MPFNEQLFNWHTAMPPVARIFSVAHKTTFLGNLRAIFHSNLHDNSQPAPHLTPHLTHQVSPLSPQMPLAHGKNTPAPPRTSASLQFATLFRAPRSVGHCSWRRSTTLQTLYSPPHLTRNIPGERPELSQPSSSHQTMARPEAMRRGHGKVQWEGLMFLVQSSDLVGIPNVQCGSLRSPWVAEKVGYHPKYKQCSMHVWGWGASSRYMVTMLSWELRTMPKELRT